MKEQTSVRFKITSVTLTAQDIAARTGLVADETWKIGTARGRFAQIEKAHGFVMESKSMPNASLDEHIKAMLKRIAPHAQHIGALINDARVEFACIVHRKAAPMLKFERDDLRWLGVMGAQLAVDIFILNDARNEFKSGSTAGSPPASEGGATPPPSGQN
jgi:hypothetical protein